MFINNIISLIGRIDGNTYIYTDEDKLYIGGDILVERDKEIVELEGEKQLYDIFTFEIHERKRTFTKKKLLDLKSKLSSGTKVHIKGAFIVKNKITFNAKLEKNKIVIVKSITIEE